MRTERNTLPDRGKLICPECNGTRFAVSYTKVVCTNCMYTINKGSSNKYGAKKTVANDGIKRDSKYEASVADELLLRKKTGDIKDYESQFKVEMWICNEQGERKIKVSHKVDFRVENHNKTYELWEAKGVETADYKWRRRLLEELWLPQHPDYTYLVLKQSR